MKKKLKFIVPVLSLMLALIVLANPVLAACTGFPSQDVYISAGEGVGNHNTQGLKTGRGGIIVYAPLAESLVAFDLTGVTQTIDTVNLEFTVANVSTLNHAMGTLTFTLYESNNLWLDNIAGTTPFANVSNGIVIETINVGPLNTGDTIAFSSPALAAYFDAQRPTGRASVALVLTNDTGFGAVFTTNYNTYVTFGDLEEIIPNGVSPSIGCWNPTAVNFLGMNAATASALPSWVYTGAATLLLLTAFLLWTQLKKQKTILSNNESQ